MLVLDVADPLKPFQICSLSPAADGRFISATEIAFRSGQQLGVADLAAGAVVGTGKLPSPGGGRFSPDGSMFAWRHSDGNGISIHLYAAGLDRTLLNRPAIGGGGTPYGPTSQLEFSPDGRYLLSVDWLFAHFGSGPPNFLVYRTDGSIAFQSSQAEFGAWAPAGSKLYFLMPVQSAAIGGDVESWDPSAGTATVVHGVASYVWPSVAPDGRSIVFDSYDTSAPGTATGGFPHLWRLDLGTSALSQISGALSARTVFVGDGVVWGDQEQPCSCGPGGASSETGKVMAHDLATGHDAVLDLTPFTPAARVSAVLDVSQPK